MKPLLHFAIGLLITPMLAAQPLGGTVNMANRVTAAGLSAPIFVCGSPAGPRYLVDLCAGPTWDSIAPVPGSVTTFKSQGFFVGGAVPIPTVPQGTLAYVQIRAWDRAFGETYEAAQASAGRIGKSNLFTVTTGGNDLAPPMVPANLVGLLGFDIRGLSLPCIEPDPCTNPPAFDGAASRLDADGYHASFHLTGCNRGRWNVEWSADLVQWQTLSIVTVTNTTATFTDANAGMETRRFYRTRLESLPEW